jgi:translation initiation factor 2B subunit (eIF-2B alpha/beta/delta family)
MMKKVALFVMAVMAASVMTSSMPVFAAQKDECLLISKNCKDEVDSIQQKIKKLNTEIKKGTKVYTPDELKILQSKLKEVNDQMDELMKPGGR